MTSKGDVEEGGGNRGEEQRQHVSHQVARRGQPRHRTGHTYAASSLSCVTLPTILFTAE